MQSLVDFLSGLGAWNWLFVAVFLFVLETIVPGVHFVWFGLAAATVGLLAFATGMIWPLQLLVFGIVAVGMVFGLRRFGQPDVAVSDEPDLNVRGQQYVGRRVVVEDAITAGRGRVRVGDTLWVAEGPDLPKGALAKVMAVHGTVLVVERTWD